MSIGTKHFLYTIVLSIPTVKVKKISRLRILDYGENTKLHRMHIIWKNMENIQSTVGKTIFYRVSIVLNYSRICIKIRSLIIHEYAIPCYF